MYSNFVPSRLCVEANHPVFQPCQKLLCHCFGGTKEKAQQFAREAIGGQI